MTEAAAPNNTLVVSPSSAFGDPNRRTAMLEDENVEKRTDSSKRYVTGAPKRDSQQRHMSRANEAPTLNYKSPQQTYDEALNFNAVEEIGGGIAADTDTSADNTSNLQSKFSQVMKSLNNSEILYPTVVLVISAISLLVVVFQKSVSAIVKCVLILLYLAILVLTVYTFKNKG